MDIVTDTKSAALAISVIQMAVQLELDVIVEGVELEEQLALLIKNNPVMIQGYLFSPPLPYPEFIEYVSNNLTIDR